MTVQEPSALNHTTKFSKIRGTFRAFGPNKSYSILGLYGGPKPYALRGTFRRAYRGYIYIYFCRVRVRGHNKDYSILGLYGGPKP